MTGNLYDIFAKFLSLERNINFGSLYLLNSLIKCLGSICLN